MSQKSAVQKKSPHTLEVLTAMLRRLWTCIDFDGDEAEYDDIALVLIEAGLLEPPPAEAVRWGPVHGPKTREQVGQEEAYRFLVEQLEALVSRPAPQPVFRCSSLQAKPGQVVNFHRLPILSPGGGVH